MCFAVYLSWLTSIVKLSDLLLMPERYGIYVNFQVSESEEPRTNPVPNIESKRSCWKESSLFSLSYPPCFSLRQVFRTLSGHLSRPINANTGILFNSLISFQVRNEELTFITSITCAFRSSMKSSSFFFAPGTRMWILWRNFTNIIFIASISVSQ